MSSGRARGRYASTPHLAAGAGRLGRDEGCPLRLGRCGETVLLRASAGHSRLRFVIYLLDDRGPDRCWAASGFSRLAGPARFRCIRALGIGPFQQLVKDQRCSQTRSEQQQRHAGIPLRPHECKREERPRREHCRIDDPGRKRLIDDPGDLLRSCLELPVLDSPEHLDPSTRGHEPMAFLDSKDLVGKQPQRNESPEDTQPRQGVLLTSSGSKPSNLARKSPTRPPNTGDQLRRGNELGLVHNELADVAASTRVQPPLVSFLITLLCAR